MAYYNYYRVMLKYFFQFYGHGSQNIINFFQLDINFFKQIICLKNRSKIR